MKKIFTRIEEKKKKLDALRPLPTPVLKNLREVLSVEWIYNSNAIEGNTLTLQETSLILREGITIKGKSLREHFEAKNHENAIFFLEKITSKKYTINEKDVLKIHEYILENIMQDWAGRYRNGQVRIVGANFVPPNARKVPELMEKLVQNIQTNPQKKNIIELATFLHHQFVWIHPFFDGNGRTGRLLMNLLFMSHGYPPAVILKNDRKKYYAALNSANIGNYKPLTLLIAQSLERSLDIYLQAVSESEEEEYISLRELSQNSSYSQEYLSLLVRQGKMDGFKEGRNWLSNKKALQEYIDSQK